MSAPGGQLRPGRASNKCGHVRDAPTAEIASKHEAPQRAALPPGNGFGVICADGLLSFPFASVPRACAKNPICRSGSTCVALSSPLCKNNSVYPKCKSVYVVCHPVPEEGRWPSSRTLGRGAVDAAVPARRVESQGGFYRSVSGPTARRRTALKRTAKACGPDASWLASSPAEVLRARPGGQNHIRGATVTNKS
jgi:hypothetical protein